MNLTGVTYSIDIEPKSTAMTVSNVIDCGKLDPLEIRAKILRLQDHMLATLSKEEQTECPLTHRFAPGVYAREIFIPAGTVIIGKIHKHAHVNIITKGSASVMTEFGPMQIDAPHTFISQPGTKRVVLALTDVVWTTIHPTNETDLAKIEEEVIAKDYDELGLLGQPVVALIEGGEKFNTD